MFLCVLLLPGFTVVRCFYHIQGVLIPGYTAFLGLWLLTGTPLRAKIVDNLGTTNVGLDSSVGKSTGVSNQGSRVQNRFSQIFLWLLTGTPP